MFQVEAETSPASQNVAMPSGPDTSKRTSADACQRVNPPPGTAQDDVFTCPAFGPVVSVQFNTCVDTPAGLRNGTMACGATPRRGNPRFELGPPEKKPRK